METQNGDLKRGGRLEGTRKGQRKADIEVWGRVKAVQRVRVDCIQGGMRRGRTSGAIGDSHSTTGKTEPRGGGVPKMYTTWQGGR